VCTLIAFHRVWPDAPLVVATNRDEAYERASSAPRWWSGEPAVLAPRDERAGGTWMGVNEAGLWVGLTNRHAGDYDPARRSRGLLCRELLDAPDAPSAAEILSGLADRYNPFHVVLADAERMVLVEYEDGRASSRRLASGCHVVTNRPFGESSGEPKVGRAWRLLYAAGLWPVARGAAPPADLEDRLAAVLADHGREGRDALCLHGGRYGTRSAAVWRVTPPAAHGDGARIGLAFADGPPCSTALVAVG
jgi:uncharacterized protein with NRDE domain